jgi:hypothetical protein
MNATADMTAHLLWTGGWDSTFRLLHLVLVQKRPVQPYYLIDSERLSTGIELKTIKRIRARLHARDEATRSLVSPVIFREIHDIAPNPALTGAWARLRERYGIGTQYDWIARFRDEVGMSSLEMSVAHADGRVFQLLRSLLVPVEAHGDRFFEADPDAKGTDGYALFRAFRFPVFDITKRDMDRISRECGFNAILEMSWFCHAPRPNGTACGVCNPCICAMEEGMGRRVPRLGRARYQLRRSFEALKRWRPRSRRPEA